MVAAARCLERAFGIGKRRLGADHLSLAAILVNLAGVNSKKGAHDEAAAALGRALAISEARLGVRHVDTQDIATELWNVKETQGGREAEMDALDAKYGI